MIKVLDVKWFTGGNSCVGIAMVEIETGERKAYISSVSGDSINGDILRVCQWGAKFPMEAAYKLFPDIKRKEEEETDENNNRIIDGQENRIDSI